MVTGGPGAGKTATLEVLRRNVCAHVVILPEAASILWQGGFPRPHSPAAQFAAQRAIARLQIELQCTARVSDNPALVVCDRGTLDGMAYWPGDTASYFAELGTTLADELARYDAVIHLRCPSRGDGYVSTENRPETVDEAAQLDDRILAAWAAHPRRVVVESNASFLHKLERALALIQAEIPTCCRAP